MRTEFLPHTKNYLVESLNKQMTEDINIEFLKTVKLYEAGGFGGGPPPPPTTGYDHNKEKKSGENTDFDGSVLFGHSNINMPGAMGLYGAGQVLKQTADWAESRLGALGGKALGAALKPLAGVPILGPAAGLISQMPSQLVGGMLRNLADLSGADWFDANVKNIGQSELQLAASKAGKPFVPLQVPKSQRSDENPFDPEVQRAKAIARAKAREEANKYRGMGYAIP